MARVASWKLAAAAAAWLFVSPAPSTASELSQLAAQLEPGEWAELDTGLTASFLETRPDSNVLQYGDSGCWDPNSRQVFYLGSPHYQPYKFIIYSEDSNSWRTGPLPFSADTLIHGYDHNAIDPATGDVYFRKYANRNVYKYSVSGNSWTSIAPISSSALEYVQVAGGLEWYPELDGLVFVDGHEANHGDGLARWSRSGNQWSRVPAAMNGINEYHNFAEYNPVHHVMWLGGGSQGSWKLSPTGVLTALGSAPVPLGVSDSLIAADPSSGNYIVSAENNTWWEFDIVNNSWSSITHSMPPMNYGATLNLEAINIPISTHGVIMYVKYRGSSSPPGVFIYRHAPGGAGDETPPSIPSGLLAQDVTFAQVGLTWSESTDDVGVAGYEIWRDGASLGTTAGTTFVDTTVQPEKVYGYAVSAFDLAGNTSATSATLAVTTPAAIPPDPPENPRAD